MNRELACLKRMCNVAKQGLIVFKGGVPAENPLASVTLERENNTRDHVLRGDEFGRLMDAAPMHLRPIWLMVYHTGMRKGEVLNLTWGRVDFEGEVIRLRPEDIKTQEGRLVPMTKELSETPRKATIYLDAEGRRVPYVFAHVAKRVGSVRRAFATACREAGMSCVVFHDLRHTFVTNMRQAGVDYFRIMAITGHKTMSAFKRYHTIDHQDLHQAIDQWDTYVDISAAAPENSSPKPLKTHCAPVAQADRARDS